MSAPTPYHSALAERLRELANDLARAQKEIDEDADVRETVGEIVKGLDALHIEMQSAPPAPLPPSALELAATIGVIRDSIGCEVRNVSDVDGPTHAAEVVEAHHNALAAARADALAEAVRVVEDLPDHLTAADDPRETCLWRADVLAALRALGGAP